MAGFQRDAISVGFKLHLFHERCHPRVYGAEIVVFQLLVFGTFMPHERPVCQTQIGACGVQSLIDQEVFLFPAEVWIDLFHIGIEKPTHLYGCFIYLWKCFQKGRFVIEGFTCVRDEDSGNTQCIVHDKCRGRRIPGCVPPRFEGVADTTAGETGGIRFLLCQQLARKALDDPAVRTVDIIDERIVLLRCPFREGLEPVGVMGGPHFNGPHFHPCSHMIRNLPMECGTLINGLQHCFHCFFGEILRHLCSVKDTLSKILRWQLSGSWHFNRHSFRCFLYSFKS